MIGVNRVGVGDFSPTNVEEFVSDTNVTFPVGFDLSNSYSGLRAAAQLGSSSNSVHIVVDRDGTVRHLARRYSKTDPMLNIVSVLDTLLAE